MIARNVVVIMTLMPAVLVSSARGEGFREDVLASAYARVAPAMVRVHYTQAISDRQTGAVDRREGVAIGILVSPEGLVMTQGHLEREGVKAHDVRVVVGQNDTEKTYPATVLQKPGDLNVVFLRLETAEERTLPHLDFAMDGSLGVGTPLAVFGLLAESLDYARIFTERRIGAVLKRPRTTFCLDDAVHFAAIGAPVVNVRGEAVGVVGFDLSRQEGGDLYTRSGHPLVYQTSLFAKYIDNPPDTASPTGGEDSAWLGVFTQPLTDAFATYWELPAEGGLVIGTVIPNSPAARAGLQPGDVIKRFNSVPITAKLDREVIEFTKLVREAGPGESVVVEFYRDGLEQSVEVALEGRPATARDAEVFEDEILGLTVRELTTDVRIALNMPQELAGVIVSQVRSGSAAQEAGLRPGTVILRLNDMAVNDLETYRSTRQSLEDIRPPQVVVFGRLGAATGFFRMEPRWPGSE